MKTHFHRLWGCGSGPVKKLAPTARLLCGTGVFLSVMAAPTGSIAGLVLIAAAAVGWIAFCLPPARVVLASSALGAAMFLPYFLLTPFVRNADASIPAGILVRGIGGLLISISTVAGMDLSELREGVLRLPLPRLVKEILLQIVQQTGTLMYETGRMSQAMAVRGATGRGGAAWRLLSNLPKLWLPRVVLRAERLADAMELRGYVDFDGLNSKSGKFTTLDVLALFLAAAFLFGAVLARWRI